jgi:hypothetical protein
MWTQIVTRCDFAKMKTERTKSSVPTPLQQEKNGHNNGIDMSPAHCKRTCSLSRICLDVDANLSSPRRRQFRAPNEANRLAVVVPCALLTVQYFGF